MPTWFKVYATLFALQAMLSPVLALRNSFFGVRIFQRPLPNWLTLINFAGEMALLLLMWAYWHPRVAAAIGSWCIPIFLAALVTEMLMVQKSSILIEAELESDAELSPFRVPLFWLARILGFACAAPAYAIGGLLCLTQMSGG